MPTSTTSFPPSNITGGSTRRIFTARILGKYNIDYFECIETGYIQTEKPYWLPEAYASPINVTDTGIMVRNLKLMPSVGVVFSSLFGAKERFLDYAGGYGIFTRIMRDAGLNFYWEDRYTPNLCARGFEYSPQVGPLSALTTFEVFEHFADPFADIARIREFSPNILFSTLLLPQPPQSPDEWWYFCKEHGQHVSFYTERSLRYIAEKHNAHLVTNGSDLHFFLDRDHLPKMVLAGWFRNWQASQSAEVRRLLRCSYSFVPYSTKGRSLGDLAKRLVRRYMFPGEYLIQDSISPEARSALKATSFARDYASFLLLDGAKYWKILSRQLGPLTWDDMRLLQKNIFSSHEPQRQGALP